MTIITSLIVLAVIILVHEWGHFIACRSAGIEVEEFSIGFGPKLFAINNRSGRSAEEMAGKTEFSLRLFPLGGFVRMAGSEPDDLENPAGFNMASPWQRIKVLAAGPFMNFVLAVVIFVFAFTLIGIPQPDNQAVVGNVVEGKPAAEAGLKAGDRVVEIDGQSIATWDQMVDIIQSTPRGNTLEITVNRDGKPMEFSIQPEYNQSTQTSILGVSASVVFQKMGLWEGIKLGFVNTYITTVMMLKGLVQLVTGAVSADALAGPVGIVRLIGEAGQSGFIYLLNFTALLSINLGVINLLPFPALDGSRIVFIGFELFRGRPLAAERENFIHLIGFVVLMALILLITFNDIMNLIKGG
jgi:regulator of sigma E protease